MTGWLAAAFALTAGLIVLGVWMMQVVCRPDTEEHEASPRKQAGGRPAHKL